MSWQIAIDGPAGAGKSTIAKMVARRLQFEYIDTGAMYRAVTLKAINLAINMDKEEEFKFLDETKIDFINQKIYLDDEDVSKQIRSLEVSNHVSLVSKHRVVREKLVHLQLLLAASKNVIMDGRDIGSIVLPNANLKIFLNASVEERARRRMAEREANNESVLDLQATIEEIEARDYKDSHREISPLVKTDDAIEIDSSKLNVDTVVNQIISLVFERGYKMEKMKQETEVLETANAETEKVVKGRKKATKAAIEETVATEPEVGIAADVEEAAKAPKKRTPKAKKETAEVEVAEEVAPEVEAKPAKKAVKAKKVETAEVEVAEEVAPEVEAIPVTQSKKEETETVAEEVEETVEEAEETVTTGKYKELQLVEGTVKEVIAASPETVRAGKKIKAKEERVLILLDDNETEGFLFRKDTADIRDDEELFDLFFEGDKVQLVIKKIYPDGGKMLFSTILLKMRNDIAQFATAIKEHQIITAKVVKNIHVGLLLKYNEFSCLLPSSQINATDEERAALVGQELEVAPIRIDHGRIRLIVSHNVANAIKKREEKKDFIQNIEIGQVYEGTVKNVESYGAFVEIGNGVEGLLHISEIDHNRVYKMDKYFKKGDAIKVQVIKVDKDHIGLSRKALLPNFWLDYVTGKQVGDVVTSKVAEINNAGIVLNLNEGTTGFLPKSEFSWERDVFIEDTVKVGDEIETKIIEIDSNKKRIIFSKKQLTTNPWDALTIQVGDVIQVTVVKALKDGFKVDYNGATGYLSKGSIRSIPADSVAEGDVLKVKVRVLEADKTRLVVSHRDAEEYQPREYQQKDNYNKFMKSQEKMSNTFGDLIGDRLNKFKK